MLLSSLKKRLEVGRGGILPCCCHCWQGGKDAASPGECRYRGLGFSMHGMRAADVMGWASACTACMQLMS